MKSALMAWPGAAAIALIIGSFVGVVVRRLPDGRDIVFGRSACPACGTRLLARDLVPLASWLWLRGKCRHCRAGIGLFYPAVEVAAVLVALSAATVASGWLLWVSCLFGWTLLALALIDLRAFLLPDALTLPLVPAGLAVAWLMMPDELADRVLGALFGFVAFALVALAYRHWRGREGLGRGDAKLLASLGAWVGWTGLPGVVLLASLMALALALLRRLLGSPWSATDRIAFGPYLAAAGWVIWLHGPLVLRL